MLAREKDGWEKVGTKLYLSHSLLFVCSSLEAFGLLGTTKEGLEGTVEGGGNR